MHGVRADVRTRYDVEIAVMQEMNWSYQDLCLAPDDLVEEILVRRDARITWERKKHEQDKARKK